MSFFAEDFLEETSKWLRQLSGYHALFMLEPIYRHQQEQKNRLHLKATDLRLVKRLIQRISDEYMKKTPGHLSIVSALWQEILCTLCRIFSQEEVQPFSPLADCIAYIEEAYEEPLHLDELADRAHMSKNHFHFFVV